MPLPVEDIVAIEQLVARYNQAIDANDGAAFAGTFVPEGVLDTVGIMEVAGHEALDQFARGLSMANPRHVASNLLIDGDGDAARMRAYVQLFAQSGDPPKQEVSWSGVYEDELVRVDGEWRFRRRVCTGDG